MSEVTQQIKDKLDIADFIRGYIPVLPAGKNFKALCPFHKEKTPSFMISPERQSWHCFGACSEGGDVIKFLMKYENLEFYEALKILAERTGIELARSGADYRRYDVLYQINNEAKEFFKKNLSPEALGYLSQRGLWPETIREFEIGLAPAGSDQLTRQLLQKGFRINEIEESGMAFRTERGTHWDRFRSRIMFPIYNGVGRVIGFTGRIVPPPESDANLRIHTNDANINTNIAKYVNSPETPIFNKSKILYGFHKSKNHIREAGAALLVEGQMDFLMAYQAGIKNVVASSGTALTGEQLRALRRLTDQLVLGMDQDEAGQKAAERGIDLALANDFSVSVVGLKDKDPADLARDNPEELKKLVVKAQPVREFYFNRYLKKDNDYDNDYDKKNRMRLILAKVKTLFSDIEKTLWLKELSSRTGIGESALVAEMEKVSDANLRMHANAANAANANVVNTIEALPRKGLIIQRLLGLGGQLPEGVAATPVNDILAMRAAWENTQLAAEDQEKELKELARQLKIELRKEQIAALKTAIAQAERENNETQLITCLTAIDKLGRQLHNLNHHGEEV